MGNTLVAGRDFTWEDVYDMRPVAMVSENLARELWKEPSAALGKQIRDNPGAPWREVIGVVGDERDDGVDKKAPAIAFWPMMMAQFSGNDVHGAADAGLHRSAARAPARTASSTKSAARSGR